MRVTQSQIFTSLRRNLALAGSERLDLNEALSTGRRIHRPSDDPSGAAEGVRLRASLRRFGQLERNRDLARDRLAQSETTLAQLYDTLVATRTLAIQGAGPGGGASREAVARELESKFEQLVSLANTTSSSGGHLFAGYANTTAPFEVTGSFDSGIPPASTIAANYLGTSDRTQMEILPGDRIDTALAGDEVFQGAGGDLFALIATVRDAVLSGDQDAVNAQLGPLQDALDALTTTRSLMGVGLSRLDAATEQGALRSDALTTRLADVEGADIAETFTFLAQQNAAYDATLAAGAAISSLSLLNFIG